LKRASSMSDKSRDALLDRLANAGYGLQTGKLTVKNRLNRMIEFTVRYYVDGRGTPHYTYLTTRVEPGKNEILGPDGGHLEARKVAYILTTSVGSNGCIVDELDYRGDLYVDIDESHLPDPTQENFLREERGTRSLPWLKIVAALGLDALAKDAQGEESHIAAFVTRELRDALIGSSIKDVFPELGERDVAAATSVISLMADGELTVANLAQDAAKSEIEEQLRQRDPRLATSAKIAEYVYEAWQAANK